MEISWQIIFFAHSSKSLNRPERLKVIHLHFRLDPAVTPPRNSGGSVFSPPLADPSCLILNNLYTFCAVRGEAIVP